MSWLALIPAALGLASSLVGKGKGKETEYVAQAPKEQQQFSTDFMNYLSGQLGKGATPYTGQIAASAMNPFTQSALGLWGASPYGQFMGGQPGGGQTPPRPLTPVYGGGGGMTGWGGADGSMFGRSGGGMGTGQPQPFWRSQPYSLGLGGTPGGSSMSMPAQAQGRMPQGAGMPPMGQRPMQGPMPQQGMMGQKRRGVPFQR